MLLLDLLRFLLSSTYIRTIVFALRHWTIKTVDLSLETRSGGQVSCVVELMPSIRATHSQGHGRALRIRKEGSERLIITLRYVVLVW